MTILFDKGCAPHGRFKPKEDRAKPAGDAKKGHKLHGDRSNYGQSADRRERRRENPERDPAAPAPGRKLLIEFACEPDSRLSAVMMECGGEAIRVHIGSFDITKAKDVSRLIAIIEDNPGCDLWASIPCGPWSTWQYVNLSIHGAEFASHLNDLRRSSQVMFAAFLRASRAVRRGGGRVAFEWPRHCLGWKQPFMQRFLADPDVETVDFDGCDFGKKVASAMPVEVDPVEQRWKRKPNTLYVSLDSETAKIPTRATSGSAGLDTYVLEGGCVPAGGSGLVSTGISIETPAGVYARIAPRSGLAVKNRIAVGGGVIDPDYDGEIKVILFNHGDEDFIVNPGTALRRLCWSVLCSLMHQSFPGRPSGEPIGDPLVSEAQV